jgi:hypothetical protein
MRISSAGNGRCACEKLKKRRQILVGLHKLNFNDTCCAGIGTMTPGDFIIILFPSTWLVAVST